MRDGYDRDEAIEAELKRWRDDGFELTRGDAALLVDARHDTYLTKYKEVYDATYKAEREAGQGPEEAKARAEDAAKQEAEQAALDVY